MSAIFSDEDLAALKVAIKTNHRSVGPKTVLALVNRLEDAETALEAYRAGHTGVSLDAVEAWNAWRQACGK